MSTSPTAAARRPSRGLVAAVICAEILVVLAGTWLAAGHRTSDEFLALGLVLGWLALAGAAAEMLSVHRRDPAPPLATWLVTSGGIGGFLLVTTGVDVVRHEDVTRGVSS